MHYRPFVPGVSVDGKTIRVFVDALKSFEVLREVMLEALGVAALDDDHWYPQEKVLLAYQKVDYLLGGRGLERFGKMVPALVSLPPSIDGAHLVLSQLDAVYHMNHRYQDVPMLDPATGVQVAGIGHYHYERAGEREALMVCDNPYPCRFDLGLCQGFVGRFESKVSAIHEPGTCRAQGDSRCTYRISW